MIVLYYLGVQTSTLSVRFVYGYWNWFGRICTSWTGFDQSMRTRCTTQNTTNSINVNALKLALSAILLGRSVFSSLRSSSSSLLRQNPI